MIYNYTKGSTIAENYVIVRNFWSKFRGQMFRKEILPMIFEFNKEQKVDLHSFFVKKPIDLIFVNSAWEVVEMEHEFMPRKLYRPKEKAMYVLELPAGTIARTNTEVGDVVHITKK